MDELLLFIDLHAVSVVLVYLVCLMLLVLLRSFNRFMLVRQGNARVAIESYDQSTDWLVKLFKYAAFLVLLPILVTKFIYI